MGKEGFSCKIGFPRTGWWIIHLLGIAQQYYEIINRDTKNEH